MSAVIANFLKPYADASFMRQQQAKIFLFFIGGAFLLLSALILTYLFIVGEELMSNSSMIRFMYCILCFVCLVLLRKGFYGISTNLAVYCCILLSILNSFISRSNGTVNQITILYFFFIFVIMATVFGNRITIILASMLDLSAAFVIVLPSTFDKKEKTTILVAFIMAHLFISLLCYLYQVIVKATIMKIEEHTEKEKEHSLLSNMVRSGRDISRDLKEISDRLKSENQSLSQRTTQQTTVIENISVSLKSAVNGIAVTSDSTEKARELAIETTNIAQDGESLISEAVDSIKEIANSGKQIAKITTLLNEIAFQTNLLSINGSIEAAHAGENGTGFATVAAAVRNLAVKSREAAKEIGNLVSDSTAKINRGTDIITNSGTVFSSILTSVKSVSELIQQISTRSQEQQDTIEQINLAMSKMDAATRKNSLMAENTSLISDKLSGRAAELAHLLRNSEGIGEITHSQ